MSTVNVSGATMNDAKAVEFEAVLPRTVLLCYLLSTPMEEIERAAGPAFADRNADEKAAICGVLTHRLQDVRLITRMSDFWNQQADVLAAALTPTVIHDFLTSASTTDIEYAGPDFATRSAHENRPSAPC